ncbi:MAG: hypothetical protein M1530_04085 [Candidatus Marsarchaeota archaeon]|nr:hypothetical protein [Candidatus Marsarchaeota archaeon]
MFMLLAATMLLPLATAQETNVTVDLTQGSNATGSVVVDDPFAADSRVCILISNWILKLVFVVILLAFLLGVAVISFGVFPEWRDHGSKLIIGSIGAVVLYLIGLPALKFLMGVSSICGL